MRLAKLLWVVAVVAAAVCGRAVAGGLGLLGAGGMVEDRSSVGPADTHAWIVVPGTSGDRGATVLHLAPRGTMSDRDGRVVGAQPGEGRIVMSLLSPPVAMAVRGNHLTMVFGDPGGMFPLSHGRTLMSLSAVATSPGVWDTLPKGRLDSLPSLRGDGLLLGFAGGPAGYWALYQGLTADKADPKKLVLQMLVASGWVDVALPAEAQVIADESLAFGPDSKPVTSALWQLFGTPDGVGLLIAPEQPDAGSFKATLLTTKLSETGAPPQPVWQRSEVAIPVGRPAQKEQLTALCGAGHVVITVFNSGKGDKPHEGSVQIFTRPLDFPESAWRKVTSVPGVSADFTVASLDGVGRIGILSAPVVTLATEAKDRLVLTEVSVGTGAVVYSGDLIPTSPISQGDYRMIGVILAYALGLVVIFLVKVPVSDAILLPEGCSIAEPGRRVVAGIIDIIAAVALASRICHVPMGDVVSLNGWTTDSGQAMFLTSIGLLIALGTGLESLFGRSLGKIITGCEVVSIEKKAAAPAGEPKGPDAAEEEGPGAPVWRLFLRNLIKWGLPPVALLGLFDATGRHRGDQIARTAVVVEGVEEEDEGDMEE